jgi:hypothetical protein
MFRLGALAFVALLAPGAHDVLAAPIISIDGPGTVTVGQSFTVDIEIADVTDLYAFQFTVTFDSLLMTATDVVEGSMLSAVDSTIFLPGVIDNSLGSITFVAATLTGATGASGAGTLFSVQFTATGVGDALVGTLIDVNNGDGLLDSTLASIDGSLVAQRAVTIRSRGVPEPSLALLLGLGVLHAIRRIRPARESKGGGR